MLYKSSLIFGVYRCNTNTAKSKSKLSEAHVHHNIKSIIKSKSQQIYYLRFSNYSTISVKKMTEKFGNISQLVCFQCMDRIVLKYSEFKLPLLENGSET